MQTQNETVHGTRGMGFQHLSKLGINKIILIVITELLVVVCLLNYFWWTQLFLMPCHTR